MAVFYKCTNGRHRLFDGIRSQECHALRAVSVTSTSDDHRTGFSSIPAASAQPKSTSTKPKSLRRTDAGSGASSGFSSIPAASAQPESTSTKPKSVHRTDAGSDTSLATSIQPKSGTSLATSIQPKSDTSLATFTQPKSVHRAGSGTDAIVASESTIAAACSTRARTIHLRVREWNNRVWDTERNSVCSARSQWKLSICWFRGVWYVLQRRKHWNLGTMVRRQLWIPHFALGSNHFPV